MPKKPDTEETKADGVDRSYTVYAPFKLGRRDYKAGDNFPVPDEYELDAAANEFRNVERKGKTPRGLIFKFYTGKIDRDTREEETAYVALPVE